MEGRVLVVSVTSWTNVFCDDSCLLDKGAHPFITHKSWVFYRKAQRLPYKEITDGLENGGWIEKPNLKPEILERVCAGLLKSPHTKSGLKKYFREQMAVGRACPK